MPIAATKIDNNNDVENLVTPMVLADQFDEVSGENTAGTDSNGPESVKFFTHGIELQLRVDDPLSDDNKIGATIGRIISEIHKLPKIKSDQISFLNHDNTQFTCADIP